jgi:hypothetical protein
LFFIFLDKATREVFIGFWLEDYGIVTSTSYE